MFCKIFFFEKSNQFKNIIKILDTIKEPCVIVTNDSPLHYLLKENNKNTKLFDEIFVQDGRKTYEIYQSAHDLLTLYNKTFENLNFKNFEIFSTIEPYLLEELALIEKSKIILQRKENVILIFKGFSFAYFIINKIATNLGYFTDDKYAIHYVDGKNSILKKPQDIKNQSSLKKKLLLIKNNISVKINRNDILKKVEKKVKRDSIKPTSIFFVTRSTDYVLTPIKEILTQFKNNNVPYLVVVFDHNFASELTNENLAVVDLFEEAYFLSSILEKNQEGQNLHNQIMKLAGEKIHHNLLLIDKIPNPLLKKLFFSAAILIITNTIFNLTQPQTVVTANDGNLIGNSIVSVAKNWKIPTYSIRSFILRPHPVIRSMFKADKICIYGNHGINTLLKMGYDKKRIILTGNIRYDYLKKINQVKQRKLLFDSLQMNYNKKLIVVGLGRWNKNDDIWMSKLIEFCHDNNFEIIIKVHPIHKTQEQFIHTQKINAIKKLCKNFNYLITMDIEPSRLLPAADLVITDHTNLGIEACLLGKSWITVNSIDEDIDFLYYIHDYTGSLFAENYEKLEKLILEILIECKHVDYFKSSQKKIIENFNYFHDGNATKRIFELLSIK